jgi:hypothetical protein
MTNGELLEAAEQGGYAVLVTTDSHLKYQQNLTTRTIGIVVLLSTSWPRYSQLLVPSSKQLMPPHWAATLKSRFHRAEARAQPYTAECSSSDLDRHFSQPNHFSNSMGLIRSRL